MKMDAAPLQTFAQVRSLKPGEEHVSSSLKIHQKKVIGVRQSCTFADVFYGEQTAEQIFGKTAKELVRRCANGYNVSVLVFGETGSENSAFLVGNGLAQVPSSSFVASLVNALFSEAGSGERPSLERPSGQGQGICRVSVKVYEVVGQSVRDLIQSSNQPRIACKSLPWSAEVEGLASQTVSTKEEAFTAVMQAWERRTLADGSVGETHPLSSQFVEFEVEAKHSHLTQPLSGIFTVVRLPGAEALPNPGQTLPIHGSGPSLVASVRNLGHYIVQLANEDVPAIKSDDPPLRSVMGKYLAANCITVVMATLVPYVTGTSTDRVLWYMDHFQKIVNHPIQNTSAAKKMFGRLATLLRQSPAIGNSPGSRSALIGRSSRVSGTRENLSEQLQSLAATNAALRAENDRLKLRSVMNVASARREVAVDTQSQVLNPSSAGHFESVAVLPVSSVHQHSRHPTNTSFTLNMDHLKSLMDREQAISVELERLRSLADAVQLENDRLLVENGDLKLNVVSLASSCDAMKEEVESLRLERVHLQGKVQRTASTPQHTGVQEGRNLLVGLQVNRLQQELLAVKKELTKVDSLNKELHSKMKMLSASYRNRLEQYIRDVTAFVKDHPSPETNESGKHLGTVLDLMDAMMSRMAESYSSELRQSEAKVGALQESSLTMQSDMEQLAGSLKDVFEAVSSMNVQVPQLLLDGLMHAPVTAPHGHSCRIMADKEGSSFPRPARVKQELMKALNEAIAHVPVAMETLHPHMTKELCTLLELLLAVKLNLLQQIVEEEERKCVSQSNMGVHMAQAQLREVQKKNAALSVRCTVAEAQVKELRMHLN